MLNTLRIDYLRNKRKGLKNMKILKPCLTGTF